MAKKKALHVYAILSFATIEYGTTGNIAKTLKAFKRQHGKITDCYVTRKCLNAVEIYNKAKDDSVFSGYGYYSESGRHIFPDFNNLVKNIEMYYSRMAIFDENEEDNE
jgi:hypothetical protein